MIQAELTSITKQIDAGLLADIERHDNLWAQWNRIVAETGENDPRIPALSEETSELANRIVATPAHTVAGRTICTTMSPA